MARPSRQATCHPEKKHRAHGLCNNCYINSRHRTPEGRAKRHDYYVRKKSVIQERARVYYQTHRPRQVALATERTRRARGNGTHKANRPRVLVRPPEVSELPRETPVGTVDKEWWKPTEKEIPNSWKMNT